MSINRYSKVMVPSEYTAPFDLNTYGQIGAQKEAEFSRNLQLLQSGLDQVAQTDLMRPADREAFQTRLAGIVNDINKHGNEDLGDATLLGNMQQKERSIYGDPNMIAAMGETQKVRKIQSQIDDDRKKGKLASQNEEDFNDGLATWLDPTDKTIGKSFTGDYFQHFDWGKKVMDTLAKVKASGSYTISDGAGGLQTVYVKTKELTEQQLLGIAQGIVAQDPQAQRQMQIDSKYLSKRMSDEGVAGAWKEYSSSIANNYQNQIIQVEQARQQADKDGNKDQVAHYDKTLETLREKQAKYAKWGSDDNIDATLQMIKKDKHGYYNEVFNYNSLKGAAGVFVYKDPTITVQTNLAKVMQQKLNDAKDLSQYNAGLKAKAGAADGGDLLLRPATTVDNAQAEAQIKERIAELNQMNTQSKTTLLHRLSNANPTTSGERYKDINNYEKDYKEQQQLYDDGQFDKMGDPAWKEHFDQLGENNNELRRKEQTLEYVETALTKDPGYMQDLAVYDNIKKKLPEFMPIQDAQGKVVYNMNRDEAGLLVNTLMKGNYTTKQGSLVDINGKTHSFEYKLLPGDSPLERQINAQIEANVAAAVKKAPSLHAWSQMFSVWGEVDRYLRQEHALIDIHIADKFLEASTESNWANAVFGMGKVAYDALNAPSLAGRFLDDVYGISNRFNPVVGKNTYNIDLPMLGTGFYKTVHEVGDRMNAIRDSYYNKFQIATMDTVKIIYQDPKSQAEWIPRAQTALGIYGDTDDGVKHVINVSRNQGTNEFSITYTTGKDEKEQKTVKIERGMEGTVGDLFPANPMADLERDLKNWSAGLESTQRGTGHVYTSIEPSKAYMVPGTTKKARYSYHPDTHKYGYQLYKGNGLWTTEIRVDSLTQAEGAIRSAAGIESDINNSQGIKTAPVAK